MTRTDLTVHDVTVHRWWWWRTIADGRPGSE